MDTNFYCQNIYLSSKVGFTSKTLTDFEYSIGCSYHKYHLLMKSILTDLFNMQNAKWLRLDGCFTDNSPQGYFNPDTQQNVLSARLITIFDLK